MKKLSLFTLVTFVSVMVIAQVSFGLKGGINLAHISSNSDDINEDKKMLPSFNLGGIINIPVGNNLLIQPHILLMGKGTGMTHNNHTDKIKITAVDVPVNVLFRSKSGLIIGAGPNLGMNLSAKEKHENDVDDLGIGNKPGQIKRFDFGANLLVGLQLTSGFIVNLNYLKGLSNLSNVPNQTWYNNIFGLGAGLLFGSANKKEIKQTTY